MWAYAVKVYWQFLNTIKERKIKVKEEQEFMLDIYGQWIPVKYIFNSEKKDKRYYEKLKREERRKNGISKKR